MADVYESDRCSFKFWGHNFSANNSNGHEKKTPKNYSNDYDRKSISTRRCSLKCDWVKQPRRRSGEGGGAEEHSLQHEGAERDHRRMGTSVRSVHAARIADTNVANVSLRHECRPQMSGAVRRDPWGATTSPRTANERHLYRSKISMQKKKKSSKRRKKRTRGNKKKSRKNTNAGSPFTQTAAYTSTPRRIIQKMVQAGQKSGHRVIPKPFPKIATCPTPSLHCWVNAKQSYAFFFLSSSFCLASFFFFLFLFFLPDIFLIFPSLIFVFVKFICLVLTLLFFPNLFA